MNSVAGKTLLEIEKESKTAKLIHLCLLLNTYLLNSLDNFVFEIYRNIFISFCGVHTASASLLKIKLNSNRVRVYGLQMHNSNWVVMSIF